MVFAEWQQLGGPPGGQIRSILYDGEFVYAGGSGGVLVSNNQGELWSLRNEGLERVWNPIRRINLLKFVWRTIWPLHLLII